MTNNMSFDSAAFTDVPSFSNTPSCVCFEWLTSNQCPRGENCVFLHSMSCTPFINTVPFEYGPPASVPLLSTNNVHQTISNLKSNTSLFIHQMLSVSALAPMPNSTAAQVSSTTVALSQPTNIPAPVYSISTPTSYFSSCTTASPAPSPPATAFPSPQSLIRGTSPTLSTSSSSSSTSSSSLSSLTSPQVCPNWSLGSCVHGNRCQFSHQRAICGDFLAHKCRRGSSCKFSHNKASGARCLDWLQNRCHRGSECRYYHVSTDTTADVLNSEAVCKDWTRGKCQRAKRCRFKHPAITSSNEENSNNLMIDTRDFIEIDNATQTLNHKRERREDCSESLVAAHTHDNDFQGTATNDDLRSDADEQLIDQIIANGLECTQRDGASTDYFSFYDWIDSDSNEYSDSGNKRTKRLYSSDSAGFDNMSYSPPISLAFLSDSSPVRSPRCSNAASPLSIGSSSHSLKDVDDSLLTQADHFSFTIG